jgi:hypothetical protein
MEIILLVIQLLCFNAIGYTQCNVKTNYRSDGIIVKYLNPELVGKGTNCELGLSVQSIGNDYFLSTTVRYFGSANKQTGDLKIQLANNQSLVLKLYSSEIATLSNENLGLAVYFLSSLDVTKLLSSNIKTVVFREASGINQIITLNPYSGVISKQLRCLKN